MGEGIRKKNYLCTLAYGDYTKEIEITTVKSTDLSTAVGNINSAATAAALAAILPTEASNLGLEDGTTKDNAYMANMIFAMKPEGGFDNNGFVAAYEIAEGLAKLDQGSITLTKFFTDYANSLGADYLTQYNAMSNAAKSDIALLFTNQLDTQPTFADLFETAKWFSGYRTADSAVTTQTLFMEFAAENSVSMTEYNSIGNDYYQGKVFEKMYDERANIATKAALIQSFNKAVTAVLLEKGEEQKPQQKPQTGGGGGGGAPSHAVSSVEPQVIPEVSLPMFNDISNHWAKDYIEKLGESGIINGFEDGSFRPDASITRAEFSKILAGVFGITGSGTSIFADVNESDWFCSPVTALAQSSIITGYDGMFMPARNITRQDMAVMIYRGLKSAGVEKEATNSLNYTDAEEVSDYAQDAVDLLTELGLLTGSDGCFNPLNTATRAEAATIFSRVLDYLG